MALEDIFRALEEQAQQEREDILSSARAQAEAIAEDAAEQAEGIRAGCVEKSEAAAGLRAAKAMNAARLDAKKQVASVKDEAVNSAFDAAAERLAAMRSSDGYDEVFQALAKEALDGVEGEAALLVDPADEDRAKRVLTELGAEAEIRPEISTSGGVVVLVGNGRVSRRNTFEDRLDRARQTSQSEVAEILFS